MRQRCPLYCFVAGIEPNNLPQSDPGLEQWLWRDLPWSAGSAQVLPIKTTPIIISDVMSSDGTETCFIHLHSWHQGQQSPAMRSRIGAVVVEGSAMEFWERQGTPYEDNPHNSQRFHEF